MNKNNHLHRGIPIKSVNKEDDNAYEQSDEHLPNYFGIRKTKYEVYASLHSLKLRSTFPCEMGQIIPTVLVTMRLNGINMYCIYAIPGTAATIPPTSFNDKFIIFKLPMSIKK